MPMQQLPTYAIAHGGGPWPWLKDLMSVDWEPLERSLQAIPQEIGEPPRAILMVTAHWETPVFTFGASPAPSMLYDYSGFPPHTYTIDYPAPGDLATAEAAAELLTSVGIAAAFDTERGFDHGTFVPAHVMYPDASIPIVQMSVRSDFDPVAHIEAGRALAPLRDQGVLIVGSGYPSYHNLSAMGPAAREHSIAFDQWLTDAVTSEAGPARSNRLAEWANAPSARIAHAREEHFLPLLVAAGAAEAEPAEAQYHESNAMGAGIASSSYRFGRAAMAP
ncbi:MAG: class III extradiol ring-cleavage dioxygenase [Actinomycetota bacterium]